MSTSDLVEVKSESEFDEGSFEIVDVNDTQVGVIRTAGNYYAIQNRCLHECGPVAEGRVGKKLIGEFVGPGKRVEKKFDEDEPIISCPWHGWTYSLKNGEQIADNNIKLPTYNVVVKDGTVYVDA